MEQDNNNNYDYTRISNKLPIMGVITLVFFTIALILMKRPEHKYVQTVEQTLEKVMERNDVIRPKKFMEIYYNNDSLYQFIDLRSAHDFIKGHLPGAVNIPLSKVLDKEYEPIFNQDKKINIMYYSDQCGACGPWLLLEQLGYKNNKILQGGYDYVKNNIIDNFSPMSANYSQENAKYDFAKIISEKGGNSSGAESTQSSGAAPVIIKKKAKKGGGGGGC